MGAAGRLLDELYSGEWGVEEDTVKTVVQSRRGRGKICLWELEGDGGGIGPGGCIGRERVEFWGKKREVSTE